MVGDIHTPNLKINPIILQGSKDHHSKQTISRKGTLIPLSGKLFPRKILFAQLGFPINRIN